MGYFTGADPRRPRPPWVGWWSRGALLLALAFGAGCDDVPPITLFEPIDDPERLFMALTLNHRAINLSTAAPYDTLRLTVTAWNAQGEPLNGLPAPTFRTDDTTRVRVTPDGLIVAQAAAVGVEVIAELVNEDDIRHADTAYVNVTTDPAPPAPATFSITPETPDAREWPMVTPQGTRGAFIIALVRPDIIPSLPARILDGDGNPIPGLQVEYQSLDPDIAQIDPRNGDLGVTLASGTARFVARTMVYGVLKADTVTISVTMPPEVNGAFIETTPDGTPLLYPQDVTIRENGYAFWTTGTPFPVEIKFEDPTNVAAVPEWCLLLGAFDPTMCDGGDIAAFGGEAVITSNMRGRQFPVPGVYEYEVTPTGHTGRVIVVAQDSTP